MRWKDNRGVGQCNGRRERRGWEKFRGWEEFRGWEKFRGWEEFGEDVPSFFSSAMSGRTLMAFSVSMLSIP